MGLSQTMVTKHIAALEARLGVKLFHRSTRRLSITEAGRNYLEASERILAEIEAADNAVAADRFEPRACFGSMRRLPSARGRSRRCCRNSRNAHPLVTVELGLNDRLVDLAEEGWDLAIRIGSLSDFEPDRAPHRALPHRRLRRAVLSEGARQAARGCRPGRS